LPGRSQAKAAPTGSYRLRAVVHGLVHGVGFRYFVLEVARQLELGGWVRNLSDGSVEVVAEGPRESLEEFLAAVERGPRNARVSEVQTWWQEPTDEFRSFNVRLF
jgi:acylphosphatase